MKPIVAIIGSAHCTDDQAQLAEQVGRMLAESGAILVCGGRTGVMEAACKGAMAAGGITIGLLPGIHASEGNPYLTVALPTGLGESRNMLVARAGQAVIAIGGESGTLSEIAFAHKIGVRVIGLGTWSAMDHAGQELEILEAVDSREAVKLALAERPNA